MYKYTNGKFNTPPHAKYYIYLSYMKIRKQNTTGAQAFILFMERCKICSPCLSHYLKDGGRHLRSINHLHFVHFGQFWSSPVISQPLSCRLPGSCSDSHFLFNIGTPSIIAFSTATWFSIKPFSSITSSQGVTGVTNEDAAQEDAHKHPGTTYAEGASPKVV